MRKLKLEPFLIIAFTICVCLAYTLPSKAAKIIKVKKGKVLLRLTSQDVKNIESGSNYTIRTKKGKKRGEVKILKIKGRKAVAKLVSGKARKSYFVSIKKPKSTGLLSRQDVYIGGLVGFSSNLIKSDTRTLEGSSYSVKGFYDYPLMDSIWIRASAGLQGFDVTDKDDSTQYAEIQYISLDGYARFMFSKGALRPWIGGYMGALFSASADAPALEGNADTTSNFGVAGGLDYVISKKAMIPIVFEYNMFPKSSSGTETTAINIRIGYGFKF